MKKKFAALCAGLFFMTGCASIISGTQERVSVNSLDDAAVIYVDGTPRGRSGISLELSKKENHTFMAKKDGCQTVMVNSGSTFNPVSLLGILIDFGIISIPIDFISGAAWHITPKDYTVTPICPVTPVKMPTPAM